MPNPLSEITADQITDTYKKGYISASKKNDLMRRKAELNLNEIVQNQGVFLSYWTQTLKHVQENWNEFIDVASKHDPEKSVADNLKLPFKLMWNQIGALVAPMTAFGEVNGAKAEQLALKAGASPGLAKVVNIAIDVGSGFIPVAGTMRAAAKGIQKVAPQIGELAAKVGGTAKISEANKAAGAAIDAEKIAEDALTAGMKAEGVFTSAKEPVDVSAEVVKRAKEFLGATEGGDFYTQLRAFRAEMAKLTEKKAHDVTLAEAEKLGFNIDDLRNLMPGTALKESEMAAYLKALDGPVNELTDLAKRTIASEPGAAEAMMKKLGDFFEYSPKFRAAEITAGRSVEILKETPPMKNITNMLLNWDPEAIAKGDFSGAMRTVAEDIVAMAEETNKLKALQVQKMKDVANGVANGPTWWGKVREGYINLLLARPVTQVRNFLGNTYAAVNSIAERELAGWLSIDDINGVKHGEGLKQFNGFLAGIGDGLGAFADAFKTLTPEQASKLDFPPKAIGGILGRFVNVPSNLLVGMDNFFKAVLTRGDYYAMATRRGIEQGLEGEKLADYVARRVNIPTEEMISHAKDFALNNTFQNDLGQFGQRAQKLLQWGPLALLFPFMKTPINLAKYAWNRTPGLQLISKSLYEDILAGGERADMAIARLTLSNLNGMFIYGLAKQGLITGGGPADPGLKRSWLAVKQPYSIKGANGWYPITNIEPATTPIGLIADFAEVHNQLDDPTAEQTAMAIALAGTRDIVDKSYWQTVGQLVELGASARAGEEPGQHALQIAQGPLVSGMSGGPLMQGIEATIDPVRREARTFMDQVRSRVPGFSSELPPVRDGYGDPIVPPQAIGSSWFNLASPFVYRPGETDKIKQEGAKLNVKLPAFPWSLGGKIQDDFDIRAAQPGDPIPLPITPQQRDRWQVIYRNIMRSPDMGIEKSLLSSQEYQDAPYALKRELFMNYLSQARNAAKQSLLVENPELAKKALNSQAAQYLPLLQPNQQAQVQQQVGESLDLLDNMLPEQRDNLLKWGILDSGQERDTEVVNKSLQLEINKPISELNKAAAQQGQ